MADIIPGTGDDGQDLHDRFVSSFLDHLRRRQEAVWAVVAHGNVLIDVATSDVNYSHYEYATGATIYIPQRFSSWWMDHHEVCMEAVFGAAESAWDMKPDRKPERIRVFPILSPPAELIDFLAKNTDRPRPRRYNSTAVSVVERDGITWLTPPEVKLYDAMKEASWMIVPQPAFLEGESVDKRPDFLLYWRGRANMPVLIEVDSDRFHSAPSQREKDEDKERLFEARGFGYLRFSAKEVLDDPLTVVRKITAFCTERFNR